VKIVAGRVADFEPGEHRVISAAGRSIGVFRLGDRFYALNNHCPHQGGPLCSGRTVPWLRSGGPGEVEADAEVALIACPWHGWEYEIATGQSFLGPGEAPARGYVAHVESGRTLHDELGHPSGRIPGPYVAETFEVHIDDDYVVVDTSSRPSAAHQAERSAS
jgi:nitrite reductase/ring-hydroxylating ferredoxin subunit